MSMSDEGDKASSLSMDALASVSADLQAACLQSTRAAAALPADLNFERTLSRPLARSLDASAERSLSLVTRLLQLVQAADISSARGAEEESDLLDNYNARVTELVDGLLERADKALDRAAGKAAVPSLPPAQAKVSQKTVVRHQQDLHKPQLRFKRATDNSRESRPWRPLLTSKPHAKTPLDLTPSAVEVPGEDELIQAVPHPYAQEIADYSFASPSKTRNGHTPTEVTLDEPSTLTLVDTPAGLREMLEHLRHCKEIAIDLEHHDLRSYRGIVCLMQVSSRTRDFIVDLLDPDVREAAEELNEVLANPGIIKVLHGADSDVIWLQRDLGLYIVNLFDTSHASRVLRYPKASLAYLLERFVDFKADKRFQVADWRIRPLDASMLRYARADTHFLLFIFDSLLSELSTPMSDGDAPLESVIAKSRRTALQLFLHVPFETSRGWYRLLEKWHKELEWAEGTSHFAAFSALYDWRDLTAREMDDSINYIMPNATLMSFAQELPTRADAAARLLGRRSPVLHKAGEIADLVNKAIEASDRQPRAAANAVAPQSIAVSSATDTVRILPAANLFSSINSDVGATSSSFLAEKLAPPLASRSTFLTSQARPGLTAPRIAAIMSAITMDGILGKAAATQSNETVPATNGTSHEPTGHAFVPESARSSTVVAPISSRPSAQPEESNDVIIVASGGARANGLPKHKSKKRQHAEVEPYDYSAAPSVLDAPMPARKEKKKPKRGEGYAKNGPRMPKIDGGQGGRSKTFLS